MSNDRPARPIIDGRVGDRYEISGDYGGKWENAKGVPLGTPQGTPMPIPPGTPGSGVPNIVVVQRPDFRKEPKNGPVHKN